MRETHLRAETAFGLIQHIVNVIDAGNAVVTHLNLGNQIAQKLVKVVDIIGSRNNGFVNDHRALPVCRVPIAAAALWS